MSASGPRPTAPGSGSEFRPWNAQPVPISITQHPMASTRRRAIRALTAGPRPAAAASPARAGAGGGARAAAGGASPGDGGGGSGIAAPGIRGSGTDGAGPGTTESPFRPVHAEMAGGVSGGPGLRPAPPGARRASLYSTLAGSTDFWMNGSIGIGRLLKFSTRKPGPRNSEHSFPDSVEVTFSIAWTWAHPGTGSGSSNPDCVGFAKSAIPNPPTIVPVSAL